jgi:predicted nucleic acid-binding protein
LRGWSSCAETGARDLGEQDAALELLKGGIVPFDKKQAETVVELGEWRRSDTKLRNDYMIAACAIASGAELMTNNVDDFERFERFGLKLHRLS